MLSSYELYEPKTIEEACRIAAEKGFKRIAVIAAIGTRQYYESRNFSRGDYYLIRTIS
jgi:elongator complex protein 3